MQGLCQHIRAATDPPCLQMAGLIEACLQRNAKARPTAKQIFDTLQELLARAASKLPPLVETGESKAETGTTATVESKVKTGTTEGATELEQPSAEDAGLSGSAICCLCFQTASMKNGPESAQASYTASQ